MASYKRIITINGGLYIHPWDKPMDNEKSKQTPEEDLHRAQAQLLEQRCALKLKTRCMTSSAKTISTTYCGESLLCTY